MARRRQGKLQIIDQIDMTPLIDLTFTLLIIFMITTPLMENAINVKPPEMSAQPVQTEGKSTSVNIDRDGQILLDKMPVSLAQLTEELKLLYAVDPEKAIYLRADESRSYKEVIQVMGVIRATGYEGVNLVTAMPEQ